MIKEVTNLSEMLSAVTLDSECTNIKIGKDLEGDIFYDYVLMLALRRGLVVEVGECEISMHEKKLVNVISYTTSDYTFYRQVTKERNE